MVYIVILLVIVLIWMVYTYNKLIRQRNMVNNQNSQIDIQLKRRFDLIPNLVEIVKGYANHEKTTLEGVVLARNTFLNTDDTEEKLQADRQLNSALTRLFAVAEAYPDLLANQNFMNLQKELSETENKIAFSRQFYNDSVFKLNNMIEMFPSFIVAKLFGFEGRKYFEIIESEKDNITLDID